MGFFLKKTKSRNELKKNLKNIITCGEKFLRANSVAGGDVPQKKDAKIKARNPLKPSILP
jgi:hypothetical protein